MSTDELVVSMTRSELRATIDEVVRGYMIRMEDEKADDYVPEKVSYKLAAHICGVTAPTIGNWIEKGILVKIRKENKVTKASVLAAKKNHVKYSRR
jgi:hypothetical protein